MLWLRPRSFCFFILITHSLFVRALFVSASTCLYGKTGGWCALRAELSYPALTGELTTTRASQLFPGIRAYILRYSSISNGYALVCNSALPLLRFCYLLVAILSKNAEIITSLVVDSVAYDDLSILKRFYYDNLRSMSHISFFASSLTLRCFVFV